MKFEDYILSATLIRKPEPEREPLITFRFVVTVAVAAFLFWLIGG